MLALPLRSASPPRSTAASRRSSTTLRPCIPTIMGAAPRIFEKAHARIEQMIAEQGRLKKMIFDWAIEGRA